jgi:hypothetical protein
MPFAAQLEAAPDGKKQTQKSPKAVLKQPDLEHSKSAALNSLTSNRCQSYRRSPR